jgi:hypothetical protein
MDADLIDEVHRLQGVYAEHGCQVFRYQWCPEWSRLWLGISSQERWVERPVSASAGARTKST